MRPYQNKRCPGPGHYTWIRNAAAVVPLPILAAIIALLVAGGCRRGPAVIEHPVWEGRVMGTYYVVRLAHVTLDADEYVSVQQGFEKVLDMIEESMSVWRGESEISRFNRAPPGTAFAVSDLFAAVLRETHWIHERSGGVFDPTIGPLAALWGFGPAARSAPPADEELAQASGVVGWHLVDWQEETSTLSKKVEGVMIDLGGVAKGFGADMVADYLHGMGFKDFLVEIGGDVRVQGFNANGDPWRIGIDMPMPDATPGEQLAGVLNLTGGGVCTSGDYRRFVIDEQGLPMAHIIDPRKGRPVQRPASSVTVWAETAMRADGISTALYVLGPQEGLELTEELEGVEALFIWRDPSGAYLRQPSSGFVEATGYREFER